MGREVTHDGIGVGHHVEEHLAALGARQAEDATPLATIEGVEQATGLEESVVGHHLLLARSHTVVVWPQRPPAVEGVLRLQLHHVDTQRRQQVPDVRPGPGHGHLDQFQPVERLQVQRWRRSHRRRVGGGGRHRLIGNRQPRASPHRTYAPHRTVRGLDRLQEAPLDQMGIVEGVGRGQDHANGPRCVECVLEDLPLGPLGVPRTDDLPQLVDVVDPALATGVVLVVDQVRPAIEQALHLPVDGPNRPRGHETVGAGNGSGGEGARRVGTDRFPRPLAVQRIGVGQLDAAEERRQPRDLEVAGLGSQQGHGPHRRRGTGHVLGRPARETQRCRTRVSIEPEEAGLGLDDQLVCDVARSLAVESPGGDRDMLGPAVPVVVVRVVELGADPIVDHDMGPGRIDLGDVALAGVQMVVEGAGAVQRFVVDGLAAGRVTAFGFDLGHRRPQHRQQPAGVGPGDTACRLENSQPVERWF